MASPSGKLAQEDWQDLAVQAILAILAGLVAWLSTEYIPGLSQMGNETSVLIGTIVLVILRSLQRWLLDTRPTAKQAKLLQLRACQRDNEERKRRHG